MKRSIKQAWLKDLREHPEAKGTGVLTRIMPDGSEKDCCWGRLCKILELPRRRADGRDEEHPLDSFEYGYENDWSAPMPPYALLLQWVDRVGSSVDTLKFSNNDYLCDRDYATVSLAGLNDQVFGPYHPRAGQQVMTFDMMADLIEYFVSEEPDDE